MRQKKSDSAYHSKPQLSYCCAQIPVCIRLAYSPSPGASGDPACHVFTSPLQYLSLQLQLASTRQVADFTMEKKQRTEPYVLDDVDRISSWLRQATHEQYEDDMSELGQLTTIEPITPRRHPSLPTFYAEASPTDTAFSGHSVFDTPSSPGNGWIEDVFSDEVPDIIPGDDSKTRLDKEQKARLSKNQTLLDIDDSEAGSRVSYDPPSEAEDLEEVANAQITIATSLPSLDPCKPRPTFLTSCLQCIHADLPCSRRAPACSRCKRKGQAALCLMHRRQYPDEIRTSDATWCTTLKLLKLRSEDQETWKKKLELADEVSTAARSWEI